MMKTTVAFKSYPHFFEKECDGRKQNTVRYLDHSDERFQLLLSGEAEIVYIINSEDPTQEFFREISDVSFYEDIVIISWKHPKESENNG